MKQPRTDLAAVCPRRQAIPLREGQEVSRIYFQSDRLSFATASLAAGESSPVDPGHADADEVLYCQRGHVRLVLGASEQFVELHEGDAALIYASVPHKVTAVGESAELVWCAAPSWGRDVLSSDA